MVHGLTQDLCHILCKEISLYSLDEWFYNGGSIFNYPLVKQDIFMLALNLYNNCVDFTLVHHQVCQVFSLCLMLYINCVANAYQAYANIEQSKSP